MEKLATKYQWIHGHFYTACAIDVKACCQFSSAAATIDDDLLIKLSLL